MLLAEALEAGANIMTDSEVTSVEIADDSLQKIILKDGRIIEADVVIGADGT